MRKSSPKAASSGSPATKTQAATRFVCVHGHFYQPPRENPWLETVEIQDSAAPFHDWNDRITAECYAPNGASRITNTEDKIIRILNNYSRMSFNFGPTLLSWLADKAPRCYHMIQEADRASAARYSGHGSALAQVYNHIIMPLASTRDALTQIRWGIADFEFRFGRRPEGMWLAETAVNRHVLDLLAQEGILYTILAPNQCARVRPLGSRGDSDWTETPNATVDPTQPYRVLLDEGRSIAVFFYDGPNSRAIAFEGLLDSGEKFGERLLSAFNNTNPDPAGRAQLSHVATDGESYGHHHKHGEMALSFAMHWLEDEGHATLTNYGEFLEKFPPTYEAVVAENTSWSCAHGVERWRSDCGCNGGKAGWNQKWRGPLRAALDYLRDATAPLAEKLAEGLLVDLWTARDAYIHVVLNRADPDRAQETSARFFAAHATHPLTPQERSKVFELMELERHTQLMYTSCGWFFDEISGIETVQIIAYAGRVLQLARELFSDPALFGEAGQALEPEFLRILAEAKSNVPEVGDGAEVYTRYVTGMKIGLEQVGAHYAISSIFRNYPEDGEIFCFDVHRDAHEVFTSGRGKVALGRARVRSRITEECEEICFAVLHLGDQNLSAAVRRYTEAEAEAFDSFTADVRAAIRRANLPEIIRLIDRFFTPPAAPYGNHDRRALPPAAASTTAHVVLDPIDPEPGQPEGAPGGVAARIAHTINPSQAPPPNPPPQLNQEPHANGHGPTPIAYSLTSLFADEQHRILRTILNQTMGEMEDSLRKIYEDHASLLHFLTDAGMTPPPALALAASFATNSSLRRALEADPFDPQEVADLLVRASGDHIVLDSQVLAFTAGQRMKKAMVKLEAASESSPAAALAALNSALAIADIIRFMPFEVTIWQAQNIWNDLLRRTDKNYRSQEWRDGFKKLGVSMNIAVDELVVEEDVPTF
jgi:alpha-amylase/alpha-mannosidase (GH57 family)